MLAPAGRGARAVFASRLLRPEPEPGPVGMAAPAFRPASRGRFGLSRAKHAEPQQPALIGDTAPILRSLSRGRGVLTPAIQAAGATRASLPVCEAMAVAGSGNVTLTGVRVAVGLIQADGTASSWFLVLNNGVLTTDIAGDGGAQPVRTATEQNYVF